MGKKDREKFWKSMRYLLEHREELAEDIRQAKREEKWCPNCGEAVDSVEKFCRDCGYENPYFDIEDFKNFFEAAPEEVMEEECNPEMHAQLSTNYCMVCGAHIGRAHWHE